MEVAFLAMQVHNLVGGRGRCLALLP